MYCNKAAKKLLFHVLYPMENLRDIIGKLQRKSQSVLCTVYVIVSTHERVCINNDFSLKKLFYPEFLTWISSPVEGERRLWFCTV